MATNKGTGPRTFPWALFCTPSPKPAVRFLSRKVSPSPPANHRSLSGGSGLRKRVQREPEAGLPGGRGSAPCRQASGAFTAVSKGVMAGRWPGRRGREWEALLVGSTFGQVTGASGNQAVAGTSARFARDERVSGMWDFLVFNVAGHPWLWSSFALLLGRLTTHPRGSVV